MAAPRASGTRPRSTSWSDQSQHLSFGEFSSKFASCVKEAPHLKEPQIIKSDVGSHPTAVTDESVDLYALTHNETSTGVMMSITRPRRINGPRCSRRHVGRREDWWSDASQFDCYYFAPQKSFASDGGLWLALCSPAAIERIETLAASWTLDPRLSRPQDCARQFAAQSDVQHARTGHDPHARVAG